MTGRHFVKMSEDSRDTSFVQVELSLLSAYAISEFSSTLYMWIDMRAAGEKRPILRRKFSLAN